MTDNQSTAQSSSNTATKGQLARIICIALFLFTITAPSLRFMTLDRKQFRQAQREERRHFAPLPKFEWSIKNLRGYPAAFEKYFNDRFGFRYDLVRAQAKLRYAAFGISPTLRIIHGLEGWFFTGISQERIEGKDISKQDAVAEITGQGLFSEKELATWASVLNERDEYFKSIGIPYVFAVAPLKHDVYPEYLPKHLQKTRGESSRKQLIDYLHTHTNVKVIDLLEPLEEAKQSGALPRLYLQTDSHWNAIGAFVAYQTIFRQIAMQLAPADISAMQLSDVKIETEKNYRHAGFGSLLGFSIEENRPRIFPIPNSALSTVKDPTLEKGKNKGEKEGLEKLTFSNSGNPPFEKMVLLGDSFAEKTAPFFTAHFKKLLFNRSILKFSPTMLQLGKKNEDKPQAVIQIVSHGMILKNKPSNQGLKTHTATKK